LPTAAVKKHFTFVGGLNTEGGPLSVAPNTWSEGDNVIPNLDGSITLRRAVDVESGYELSTHSVTTAEAETLAFASGEWNNVAGDADINFIVVQHGDKILFYENNGTTVSPQIKSFTIDLSTYHAASNTQTVGVAPVSFTNAAGDLIIVSRDIDPILVTYDEGTDAITVTEIDIRFRDFIGIDDGLDIDENPATLSDEHKYNLLNQGWDNTKITAYNTAHTAYPSNAQSWTAGKNATDDFDAALLVKQHFGTSPAPKGRYVLNLFARNRGGASGIGAISTEVEFYRPTTVAFFASRAWYAGVKSADVGTWVLFSQVAEIPSKLGKCYQDADPTSEIISDLVATDGGVIPIQDAGTVVKLLPYLNSIIVFATNGVWQIVGGSDTGFSADAYEVRKVSEVGCVAGNSVVATDSGILYWGLTGIQSLTVNQTGGLVAQNISEETVNSFYTSIPFAAKAAVKGVYSADENIVYWLFNGEEQTDSADYRFHYNRVLCLRLNPPAFYTMTIGELAVLSPYVVGMVLAKARTGSSLVFNVVDADRNQVVETYAPDEVELTQYTTPGTYEYTVPAGVTQLFIRVQGAGGGGGHGVGRTGIVGMFTKQIAAGGGGGGAGGYREEIVSVTPGEILTITVGAGGSPGGAGAGTTAGSGSAGGSSSVIGNTINLVSTGGGGGAGAGTVASPVPGGAAGSPSGQTGSAGDDDVVGGVSTELGSGGGDGASSASGTGGTGGTYNPMVAGTAGGVGAGGGGGSGNCNSQETSGGSGGRGQVVIEASPDEANNVVATFPTPVATGQLTKFVLAAPVAAGTVHATFGEFNVDDDAPDSLRDWFRWNDDGIAYTGYLTPAYDFGEEQGATKFFQALYVQCFFRRTETDVDSSGNPVNPSSCLMQARWDWSDSAASNRWGPQQQVYRHNRLWIPSVSSVHDTGSEVVVTKNKIRGRGKVLQLRFDSEADKDMQLLGWAITYIGNDSP
jgi:hypothetical protein